ncbi:MAG TPA: nuclear transport factor 2 family protein [Sphingomicrobium sp.]|jgi:hypothetical protein
MTLLAILAAAAAAAAPVTVPPQAQLEQQIAAADAEFFKLFFEGRCDIPRFREWLTDDVEFYHDKSGFNVHKADDFVAIFNKNCHDREDPPAWRTRRELVRSSLHVDPVPGWGAMEVGEHLVYERHGVDGKEMLAGRAKFAMVWVLGPDGKWRLSRVLSYAHGKAE